MLHTRLTHAARRKESHTALGVHLHVYGGLSHEVGCGTVHCRIISAFKKLPVLQYFQFRISTAGRLSPKRDKENSLSLLERLSLADPSNHHASINSRAIKPKFPGRAHNALGDLVTSSPCPTAFFPSGSAPPPQKPGSARSLGYKGSSFLPGCRSRSRSVTPSSVPH